MVLLIDNYDSFTFNILHFLGDLGIECQVIRNDKVTIDAILNPKLEPQTPPAIIISPGPATPDTAGISLELIKQAAGKIPILGICLGHQSIGQVFGGKVIQAPQIVHGKRSLIIHKSEGIFQGIENNFQATRYHSLIVERDTLPDCLKITAETEDGIIMGLEHTIHHIYGVQFHPESIASQQGHKILSNFLRIAKLSPHRIPENLTLEL